MTLLFFSDITWGHLYQRPQHLASRLSQHGTVLWVEPATLGTPRSWRPAKKAEGLYVVTLPQFPHNAKSRRIRSIARFLSGIFVLRGLLTVVQTVLMRRACKTLGIDPAAVPAVVENFQFAPLIQRLHPATVLFDYIDDAFGFIEYPAYVYNDWRRMIRIADTITATSGVLQRQIEKETLTPVRLIENGVHAASYATPAPRPADLPGAMAQDASAGVTARPASLIMYVGTISHWFDFDLLDAMLAALPEAHVVLIGPVHPDCTERLNASRKFPNLHILGTRAHADVPAYLSAAAVGIIPFQRNRLTEAVNPVKLYEYAAAGIPVVTTAFSDDLERFKGVASIARNHEEFIQHLRTVLGGGAGIPGTVLLRQFAGENDWQVRASAIAELITAALHARHTG